MLAGLGRLIPHPLRQSPKGTDHPSPEKTAFSDTVKGKGGGVLPDRRAGGLLPWWFQWQWRGQQPA